jgi:2-dehydropantoate 2-reductase
MNAAPWYVLGAGSLGTLWACRLSQAGVPVQLLLRNPARLARYEHSQGLRLIQGSAQFTARLPASTAQGEGVIVRLLVACKAYDAEAAVVSVRHRLAPGAQVLLLQNGLGSQQAVADALPHAQVYFASTTEGAYQRKDGATVFAGQGFTWVGSSSGSTPPPWLADLTQAAIPHQWTEDILARLWRKLAINCAINPLTVLLHCTNGGLLAHSNHLTQVCEELATLLIAADQATAAEGLQADVNAVITATAANYSSMYQDVAAGRRTEVSYLLGYACAQARRLGLAVPVLTDLHQALLAALANRGLPTV